jgi:hypothetical protein
MPVETGFAGHDGDNPSKRALVVATIIAGGVGVYAARKLRDPFARTAVRVAGTALTVPLAVYLTRLGL